MKRRKSGPGYPPHPGPVSPKIPREKKALAGKTPYPGTAKSSWFLSLQLKGPGPVPLRPCPATGRTVPPYYPAAAREQGWQGTALLKVLVLKNGSVGSLEIKRSSGYAILDRSALKAVKDWKFVPAQKDGQPIEMGVEIPVTFRLE